MDTTQTVRERSRNISRSLQGHDPGLRWSKHPTAIAPVWLEKPARIAALAMRTVGGLLVGSLIQRQVRLYLRLHAQQVLGNKGTTAIPTTAVILA